eukprot:TRINITY_DN7787_c0_g1_i4.p1 TRINITY_DN7787_c0_g1~~TRINITY_DN7787_c0_g1_i4.p1  ORF type:complete len:790 (-),score=187.19 TRINITY_DN7787_c0_g1_i4:285-2654(-)
MERRIDNNHHKSNNNQHHHLRFDENDNESQSVIVQEYDENSSVVSRTTYGEEIEDDDDDCADDEHDRRNGNKNSWLSSIISGASLGKICSYFCWIWLGYITYSLSVSFLSALYFCAVSPNESSAHCVLYAFFLTPLLLCSVQVRKSVENCRSLWIAISMTSFLPYYFSMQHFAQGVFYGLGFGSLMVVHYHRFCQPDKDFRRVAVWALLTGLIVLLFIRYTNYSLNPLFASFGFSVFALVLTLVCAVFLWFAENYEDFSCEPQRSKAQVPLLRSFPVSQPLYMSITNNIEEEEEESSSGVDGDDDEGLPAWRKYLPEVGTGVCFGAALFFISMFFTGYSVLPRWAGIEPFPYALISVFCLTIGIMVGAMQILHNIFTWIVIVVAVGLLCFAPSTPSFLGGCLLALFIPAFLFSAVDQVKSELIGPFVISSVAANFLLTLFMRFVVDPNYFHFVFFGRPWIPLLAACLFLGLSFSSAGPPDSPRSIRDRKRAERNNTMLRLPPRLCFLALFLATLVGFLPSTMIRAAGKVPLPNSKPLVPLTPVGMKSPANDSGASGDSVPVKPFSVVQFNIRQGYDEGGFTNLERILDYMTQHDHPSIVGLQEVETNYMWTGSIDVVEYLSYKLRMYTVYGSRPRESSLGAAILTKFPIFNSNVNCFSSSSDQAATPTSCASALVKFFNRSNFSPLDVFVSQTRQESDGLTPSQSREILKQISEVPPDHAVLWLGEITFLEDQGVPTTLRQQFGNFVSCRRSDSQASEYQFFKNLYANHSSCGAPDLSTHKPITTTFVG